MILLVSYDLDQNAPPEAYERVQNLIKNKATGCIRVLYSQWLVQTGESPDQWDSAMQQVADKNKDKWLIVVVHQPYAGWVDKTVGSWLNTHN